MISMNDQNNEGDDIRISNFSQMIALIFVTLVIGGSILKILFF